MNEYQIREVHIHLTYACGLGLVCVSDCTRCNDRANRNWAVIVLDACATRSIVNTTPFTRFVRAILSIQIGIGLVFRWDVATLRWFVESVKIHSYGQSSYFCSEFIKSRQNSFIFIEISAFPRCWETFFRFFMSFVGLSCCLARVCDHKG